MFPREKFEMCPEETLNIIERELDGWCNWDLLQDFKVHDYDVKRYEDGFDVRVELRKALTEDYLCMEINIAPWNCGHLAAYIKNGYGEIIQKIAYEPCEYPENPGDVERKVQEVLANGYQASLF